MDVSFPKDQSVRASVSVNESVPVSSTFSDLSGSGHPRGGIAATIILCK